MTLSKIRFMGLWQARSDGTSNCSSAYNNFGMWGPHLVLFRAGDAMQNCSGMCMLPKSCKTQTWMGAHAWGDLKGVPYVQRSL